MNAKVLSLPKFCTPSVDQDKNESYQLVLRLFSLNIRHSDFPEKFPLKSRNGVGFPTLVNGACIAKISNGQMGRFGKCHT